MRLLALIVSLSLSLVSPLTQKPSAGDPFIMVNKKNHQLAFVQNNKIQKVVRAATGKSQELTPEGLFTVTVKAVNPYYRRLNIPGGDPKNPLGSRWIGFDAKGTDGRIYGVHGTNRPELVGTSVSHGCIRLKNSDVEDLYNRVPIGTKILVTNSGKSFLQLAKEYGAIK